MNYYFAPMEGLTDSIYRREHHRFFGGVDRYYMPFFSPTIHRALTSREIRELPKAESEAFTAVPQVLTKDPGDFLWAAAVIRDLGYGEINLNIGCPSGTVVAKGKGSGMLRDLDELARFFDSVFSDSPLPISVKTRIGLENPEEFVDILELTEEEWIKGFAFRLRNALYQSGMRLYEIADRVDIAEGCISRYVRGKVVPSLYSISRLAAAIDCSVDELLPRDFVPLDDC